MLKAKLKKILIMTGLFSALTKAKDALLLLYYVTTGPIYRYLRYSYSRFSFYLKRKKAQAHEKRNIISLLCPTRGRPKLAERLVRSVCRTAASPDRVEIIFYLDSDDETKDEYISLFKKREKEFSCLMRCEIIVGEPMSVSRSWNILAEKCKGELLSMANDDQVYVDYGWDHVLDTEADKFPDRIFCIWFNDGFSNGELCTFPIVSRRWVEALGYFTPGIFEFAYNDAWISNIAGFINRRHYIPHILTEHLHYELKKSFFDSTYNHNRPSTGIMRVHRDCILFKSKSQEVEEAAEKLKSIIDKKENLNL